MRTRIKKSRHNNTYLNVVEFARIPAAKIHRHVRYLFNRDQLHSYERQDASRRFVRLSSRGATAFNSPGFQPRVGYSCYYKSRRDDICSDSTYDRRPPVTMPHPFL